MKDKQFNIRLSNDDLEILSNVSQKLHLPYSKCILLSLYALNYITQVGYNGYNFYDCLTIYENHELMRLIINWKKTM